MTKQSTMSVRCFEGADYKSYAYTWPSNDPNIGSSLADKISSFQLAPWSQVVFYADKNYTGDNSTFTNDSTTTLSVPNLKLVVYQTKPSRNMNDSITSLKISSLAVPACASSMSGYLAKNPDVAAAQLNPWQHYNSSGAAEGRFWAEPYCDGRANACNPVKEAYLKLYPDVVAAGVPAWQHFVQSGQKEGRAWPGIACDGRNVLLDPAPYAAVMLAKQNLIDAEIKRKASQAAVEKAAQDAADSRAAAAAAAPTMTADARIDSATKTMETIQPANSASASGSGGAPLTNAPASNADTSNKKTDPPVVPETAKPAATTMAGWKIALLVVAAVVVIGGAAAVARKNAAKKMLVTV